MFHEADHHSRLLELLQFGPESYDITKGEMLAFGESYFRENGRDPRLLDMAKPVSYTHLTLPTILRV